jgi:UDP-glucose 4-epimerase
MKVLVTGGAGYIGSHTVLKLLNAGHQVTVVDNLSHGHREAVDPRALFVQADIGDFESMLAILKKAQIEAVIHFAAFIEVGESVTDPLKYYFNNFSNALNLLRALNEAQVKKIVFSSTAAVYGNPLSTPIQETDARNPINPYGRSKMMVEQALEDFSKAYNLGYAILRYFNVAGASPTGKIGEAHEPESHLIPRILKAAGRETQSLSIFGTDYPTPDGTCIRDYVHVDDLADAHLLAMQNVKPGSGEIYNLGSENGFSVREVIEVCRQVTEKPIQAKEEPRRAGDPAVLVASSQKIKSKLGWKPQHADLKTIITHAWKWHQSPRF